MDAPCCDVFELVDGKIKRFDCYNEASMIFSQLGVLGNLEAALTKGAGLVTGGSAGDEVRSSSRSPLDI
jgi:hypothetical protein